MIVGAVAVGLSLKAMFILGFVPIGVAVLRRGFFSKSRFSFKVLWTIVILALIGGLLIIVFKIVPKPKEPASVEDIAVAVKKKLTESVQSVGETPASKGTEKPQPPLIAANKPKGRPKPKPEQSSEPAPNVGTAPALQAHLTVTQSQKISTRSDAPLQAKVVVQTDKTFPSLKLVMQCNKPLVDAIPTIGGAAGTVQMMVSSGILNEHPNVFVYSYGSSTPAFGPSNPLIIDVWSKEPVKCDQVATL